MPRPPAQSPPAVVQKTYEFILWLLPKVESFPRAYRFTVGERLSSTGLDLLTTVVEAAYTRNKQAHLETANRKVNAIRYLLRLAKDLKLINLDAYGFSAAHVDEIGRMIGGWLRKIVPHPGEASPLFAEVE